DLTHDNRHQIESQLIAHAGSAEVQQLVAEIASDHMTADDLTRHVAFQVLANARLNEVPDSWVSAVVSTMNTPGTAHLVNAALAASRFSFKETPAAIKETLLRTIRAGLLPDGPRLEALAAIANGLRLDGSL